MLTVYLISSEASEDFLPSLQPQQLDFWQLPPATTHKTAVSSCFFFYIQQSSLQPKKKSSLVAVWFRRDVTLDSCLFPRRNIYLSALPLKHIQWEANKMNCQLGVQLISARALKLIDANMQGLYMTPLFNYFYKISARF